MSVFFSVIFVTRYPFSSRHGYTSESKITYTQSLDNFHPTLPSRQTRIFDRRQNQFLVILSPSFDTTAVMVVPCIRSKDVPCFTSRGPCVVVGPWSPHVVVTRSPRHNGPSTLVRVTLCHHGFTSPRRHSRRSV